MKYCPLVSTSSDKVVCQKEECEWYDLPRLQCIAKTILDIIYKLVY